MIVDGNNFISHYLKNGKPLCAGKIGVTELNLLYCEHNLQNAARFLPHLQHEVEDIAGLFPYNKDTTVFEKYVFDEYCKNARITELQHLEPYFFDKPWTNYLEGKKVLVFSPFADSIQNNFNNLDKIWGGRIKPNFKLKTIKYPFALKIQPSPMYSTSDEVYKKYLNILHDQDFDIGLFGTGYTSLLFTAEAKRMGKAGIHLGGSTQILFGVKGQRWREIKEFQPFFNEYWTDPLPSELPEKRNMVEGGCYW